MSHCAGCGRFVGPHDACPYCGGRMSGRMPIRVVKLAAMVLATVGLAILWFVATRAEVPIVAIGHAGATMNLAYVRVEGRCTRTPAYDPQSGYLSFWIADGTGELYVASYGEETQTLVKQARVPAFGDRVSVAGTLRVREDFRSLTVNASDEVTVTRARPEPSPIGAIAPEQTYRRVRVQGQVRQVVEPYEGLRLVTVRDATGAIAVALSDDLIALTGVAPALEVGQPVEVVAAVSEYQGRAQLVPASVADIILLDRELPIATRRSVVDLSQAEVGTWAVVHGTAVHVDPFSKGVRLTLDDGTGAITVLLWQDVHEAIADELHGDQGLSPGAEVEVQGEVAEYKGELEVIPELAADVRILALSDATTATPRPTRSALPAETPPPSVTTTDRPKPTVTATPSPAPTPTPSIELTSLSSITVDRVGDVVTAQGVVVDTASFSHGFRLTLDDGQGRIVLLLWHDVFDECREKANVNLGATVRTQGEISQYQGQLQIEPRSGGDVKVVRPAVGQAPRRQIGSIGAEDAGQRVMVEGEVVRIDGLPSAVKVFLGDGDPTAQKEIPIFIWRNVLDRIVGNTGLGTPGSQVRVVGRVQVYQGDLEIVPALPNDVTVLATP